MSDFPPSGPAVSRRTFVKGTAVAAAAVVAAPTILAGRSSPPRPNILWIYSDDHGPELGCYGCPQLTTPHLDRLAAAGTRFTRAFTTAPVCSASRSALFTGMYQTSIGAQNHRGNRDRRLPAGVRTLTDQLRDAGYFTAMVVGTGEGAIAKTDFNFAGDEPFDGTDWRQRASGQPFYAQVNFFEPHRPFQHSPHAPVDPARIELPPYTADTPEIRADYARYFECINMLDVKAGALLARLEDDGLLDNTLIFFTADNGRPHFRDKQFLYDGGIHVPLIAHLPGTIPQGLVAPQLVSGIDLTATTLAMAGVTLPPAMQGRSFLESNAVGEAKLLAPRSMVFAARDRCDETVDRIRCVRTDKWKYIRNFMPERPWSQPNEYKMDQYPAWGQMQQMAAAGKLTPQQARFFGPERPAEELYDLDSDPHEVNDLAQREEHRMTLSRLREALDKWIIETGDQGAVMETPEEIARWMH